LTHRSPILTPRVLGPIPLRFDTRTFRGIKLHGLRGPLAVCRPAGRTDPASRSPDSMSRGTSPRSIATRPPGVSYRPYAFGCFRPTGLVPLIQILPIVCIPSRGAVDALQPAIVGVPLGLIQNPVTCTRSPGARRVLPFRFSRQSHSRPSAILGIRLRSRPSIASPPQSWGAREGNSERLCFLLRQPFGTSMKHSVCPFSPLHRVRTATRC